MTDERTSLLAGGPQGERGFSLLEGILAAGILGVGLLGLTAMQGMAMMGNLQANELTVATTLAADIFERIHFNRRNVAVYDGMDTRSSSNCSSSTMTASTQTQARGDCLMWDSVMDSQPFENMRGQVAVSSVSGPVALGQRTVTVTLTWMGSMKSGAGTMNTGGGGTSVKRARTISFVHVVAPE